MVDSFLVHGCLFCKKVLSTHLQVSWNVTVLSVWTATVKNRGTEEYMTHTLVPFRFSSWNEFITVVPQWSVPNLILQDSPVASDSFTRAPATSCRTAQFSGWLNLGVHITHDCKVSLKSLGGETNLWCRHSQVDGLRSLHIATNTSLNIVPLGAKHLVRPCVCVCMCACVCVCVCVCVE